MIVKVSRVCFGNVVKGGQTKVIEKKISSIRWGDEGVNVKKEERLQE